MTFHLRHLLLFLPAVLLPLAGCAHLFGGERTPPPDISGLGKVHLYYMLPESEAGDVRFHVLRSESRSGPFERLTDEPVAPPEDPPPGEPVRIWTDYGLPLGADYYYYLQRVGPDGEVRKATATGRSRVTVPLVDADVPALEERGERERKL